MHADTLTQVISGTPAHRSGVIRPGDVIYRVNAIDVSGMNPEALVTLLRKSAIDCKWTYGPLRLQLLRETDGEPDGGGDTAADDSTVDMQNTLMTLMSIAVKKNSRMVASKKPNPIRLTLLQRGFCDKLDKALADHGYYDVVYRL